MTNPKDSPARGYPVLVEVDRQDDQFVVSSPAIPGLVVENADRHLGILQFMDKANTVMAKVGHQKLDFTFSKLLG